MITPIIKKEDLFKGYSEILLISIYTDKIFASIAKKEKDSVSIIATAMELREGNPRTERVEQSPYDDNPRTERVEPQLGKDLAGLRFVRQSQSSWTKREQSPYDGGELTMGGILLNSEKAIQKLPSEILANVKNAIYVLGGGVSEFQLTVENKIRIEKNKKISEQEIADLASKNQAGFINIEEIFLVDGFAVENPVGMDGKEITARILSIGWSEDLEKIMSQIAVEYNMRYLGALDARLALVKSMSLISKDYCLILIFEKNITICIIKKGSISAISNIEAGYGIIAEQISRRMDVGLEEGKSTLNNFNDKKLDKEALAIIGAMVAQSASEIKGVIRKELAVADKDNLLPGNISIVSSGWNPELKKILIGADWLADLPIERNAIVNTEINISKDIVDKRKTTEEFQILSDCAVLRYLNNL